MSYYVYFLLFPDFNKKQQHFLFLCLCFMKNSAVRNGVTRNTRTQFLEGTQNVSLFT
jgi:hypothetical protein